MHIYTACSLQEKQLRSEALTAEIEKAMVEIGEARESMDMDGSVVHRARDRLKAAAEAAKDRQACVQAGILQANNVQLDTLQEAYI